MQLGLTLFEVVSVSRFARPSNVEGDSGGMEKLTNFGGTGSRRKCEAGAGGTGHVLEPVDGQSLVQVKFEEGRCPAHTAGTHCRVFGLGSFVYMVIVRVLPWQSVYIWYGRFGGSSIGRKET